MKSKPHKTTETKEQQNAKTTKTNAATGCSQRSWRGETAPELNATHSQHLFSVTKPSSPVRTSLLNCSAEKGRPSSPCADRLNSAYSFSAHPCSYNPNFSSTYTQMKDKLTGLGPEKRQRRQTKMLHRQSKRNIRAEDTNETISGPKQHFGKEASFKKVYFQDPKNGGTFPQKTGDMGRGPPQSGILMLFLQHPHDAALKFSMQHLHTRVHCSDPICSRSSSNRH